MKCTKIKYSLLLIVLMTMVFTMSCKTETEGDFKPKRYYTISGEAFNIAGEPLQNVTIEVTGYNMYYSDAKEPTDYFGAQTDSDGVYTLEVISTERVDNVSLKFSGNGLVPNYVNVGVTEDQTVEKSAMLQTRSAFQTITDTTIDNTITFSGGTSVVISANTLVDDSGAAVSAAQVSVTYIDTTAEIGLLPGEQYSTDGGSLKLFSTFGMAEIIVRDTDGDPLYLASGSTATISIPLGAVTGTGPPATVTLWYYDEAGAEWLPQGDLTLNGAAYEGTISHFSIFNAGISFDPAYIQGTVIDQIEDIVYSAEISLFKDLFSDEGVWQAWYLTGPEGNYPSILDTSLSGVVPDDMRGYIPVPSGTEITLYAKYINTENNDELFEHSETFTVAAGETLTIEPIVFELSTTAFITGTVFYENGQPAEGMWLRFMEPPAEQTSKVYGNFGRVDAEGTLVNVVNYVSTTDPEVAVTAETEGYLFMSWGPPDGDLTVISWEIEGEEAEFLTGSDSIILYTSTLPGLSHNHKIILQTREEGPPPPTPMTYVRGTATLADGTYAPVGSWVVFKGSYSDGTPYAVRAQVTADGVFPDPNGDFDTELVDGDYYIAVPANTDYWVEIQDVVSDPVNPQVRFVFEYTSGNENATDNIVIGANALVTGIINDAVSAPLADKMVTFVETEPEEDPDNEGEYLDPHTVIAYTDTEGVFEYTPTGGDAGPVPLKFDTQYTVTVSEYQVVGNENVATDVIYTFYYTSGSDASLDEIIYPPPVPPTVSGTVYYSDGTTPGEGLFLQVVNGGTTVRGVVAADGTIYAANAYWQATEDAFITLEPGLAYTVTVTNFAAISHDAGTVGPLNNAGTATLNIVMATVDPPIETYIEGTVTGFSDGWIAFTDVTNPANVVYGWVTAGVYGVFGGDPILTLSAGTTYTVSVDAFGANTAVDTYTAGAVGETNTYNIVVP